MTSGDKGKETPSEKTPSEGHTVIEVPEHVDLRPGTRDNPPAKGGHTEIKAPEGRNLEEPTEAAEEAHKRRGT